MIPPPRSHTKPRLSALLALLWLAPVAHAAPASGVHITPQTRNYAASKTALPLARGGKALLPIVISARASDSTKAVASELSEYLKRISGASFEVKAGDGNSGIVLGTIKEFPTPTLDQALSIYHSFDGREAYAIRARPGRLLLLGATDLGASHAAYRLLSELGCRWFFPNPNWEIVPSLASLSFGRDITDRPAFLSRNIWYAWGVFSDGGHPRGKSAAQDYADWKRRNGMAESFVVNAGHALFAVIDGNKAEFDKHPEYYALTGGKRQGPQIELGNPAVRQMVVDYALKYLSDNPQADMVSLDPADGGGYSESPESLKLGTPGDAIFGMANEVARALQKAYPNQRKMVGLYAYNWHSDPPPFVLEPNVYIQLTMAFNGGKMSLPELLEAWPSKARNLGFYAYFSTWLWDHDRWPGGQAASRKSLKGMFEAWSKANAASGAFATSVSAESGNNWGPHGRGYYLANALMWNPQADADALLDDFYQKSFGSGARAMKAYYEMADASPPMSPGVLGALFRRVDEASRATASSPEVQNRLDDIKNYLRYEYLSYRMEREGDAAKKAAMEQEVFALVYRTRYSYMDHWEALRQNSIREDQSPAAPKPWKIEAPVTHAETQKGFEEGLAYFPDLKVPSEQKFSADLVAVNLGGQPVATSQYYQEGSLYALLSLHGEPLKIKVQAGDTYGGLRHVYKITDASGKVLKSGKPAPKELVEFSFPVPAPGLYYLDFHDNGAYSEVFLAADQPAALPLRDRGFRAMRAVPEMYFYVPRGTRQIEYYFKREPWQFGGAHQITDPGGRVAKEVDVDGDYVSVPVPDGMDGKAWKIGGPSFGLGRFIFFNVPNYLSPSPAMMLVPREVARKDGLKILQ